MNIYRPFNFIYLKKKDDYSQVNSAIACICTLILLPINLVISILNILAAFAVCILSIISWPILKLSQNLGFLSLDSTISKLPDMIGLYTIKSTLLLIFDLIAWPVNLIQSFVAVFSSSRSDDFLSQDFFPFPHRVSEYFDKKYFPNNYVHLYQIVKQHIFRSDLKEFGLNPDDISDKNQEMPPTICAHGYQSNQAAWLPLAEYLENHDYQGAVFAVTLPSEWKIDFNNHNSSSEWNESLKILKNKYKEIAKHYQNPLQEINLIGHSRGSWVVSAFANALSQEGIRVNVLSLDNGFYDYYTSQTTANNIHIESDSYNTGHTMMLHHPEVLKACHTHLMFFAERHKQKEEAKLLYCNAENTLKNCHLTPMNC